MIKPPDTPHSFAALPAEHRARIEAELAPGEQLLWAGRPDPARPEGPRRSEASFAVWMVAWFLLGLFCIGMATLRTDWRPNGGQISLFCIGIAAAVIAFLMAVSYVAAFARRGPQRRRWGLELYMLTDRRAVIWEPDQASTAVSVRQYPAGSLRSDQIERLEHPDGTGSLMFTLGHPRDQCFASVADVRQVDALVRRYLVDPKMPIGVPHPDPNDDDYEEPF